MGEIVLFGFALSGAVVGFGISHILRVKQEQANVKKNRVLQAQIVCLKARIKQLEEASK